MKLTDKNKINEKTADFLFNLALLIFGGVILSSILEAKFPSLIIVIGGMIVMLALIGGAYFFLSKVSKE
jgi:hypothetical protein